MRSRLIVLAAVLGVAAPALAQTGSKAGNQAAVQAGPHGGLGSGASLWSWDQPMSDEALAHALPVLQDRLRVAGCFIGASDGRLGPMTRGAIAAYQAAIGVKARPVVSERLLDSVLNRSVRCARPGGPMREPEAEAPLIATSPAGQAIVEPVAAR
ncbi:peptidoglycan-binding domain-containing protein [Arenibaculum pallidiluteum]|uniref:peptidoglycan-binding domain-containing protein n=1 Tax=Arenibaculum pallidiluteum TaxID=2812559 RepID=UPI001A9664BF|nr:peptidoglycan-binding domain-containing protein [Arenibaculum pallidiluteum]